MTKATVRSGDTLSLSGRSIKIGVPAAANNPMVLLALADGSARGGRPSPQGGRRSITHSTIWLSWGTWAIATSLSNFLRPRSLIPVSKRIFDGLPRQPQPKK